MDPGAYVVGSLLGDGHPAGNSSRDWQIDEGRKDSALKGLVQMGCRDGQDSQMVRALAVELGLQAAVGKAQGSLQA